MLDKIKLIDDLKTKFNIIRAEEKALGKIFITIKPEVLNSVIEYLFKNLHARFVVNVGTDEILLNGNYAISYIFSLDKERIFLCLRVKIDPASPIIDSITPIIPGANWAEREARDVIGVQPRNHPDPRRLILADDWPDGVYPLRKDFPCDYKPPSHPECRTKLKTPPEGTKVIPIGPFYPVLEEPTYIKVFVEGERIVGCDYRGFYNHRGIEKLGDNVLTYNQICFVAERICGICGFVHSCCYCQTVEEAARIEIPPRARYIRTSMLELERIQSHLLWLGIAGHIIGFDTILMQSWRIREPLMWICEQITGNRKTYGMNLIGGVRRDIPEDLHPKILEMLENIKKELNALIKAIVGDPSLMKRLKNVGILKKDEVKKLCSVGPTARGSGVKIDSRKDHPYAAYDKLQFNVVLKEECDSWARTMVRLEEVLESINIIKQALKEMPEGEIMADVKEIPAGREAVSSVEAPRGEAHHYILTGTGNRPYRWKVRAPTYANLQTLSTIIKDEQIADVPIALGSLDPCFSCTERVQVVNRETDKKILNGQDLIKLCQEKTEKMLRGE
ncbi:MAG: NADH-quinone oxidoreductase subunit C [bacterium]